MSPRVVKAVGKKVILDVGAWSAWCASNTSRHKLLSGRQVRWDQHD